MPHTRPNTLPHNFFSQPGAPPIPPSGKFFLIQKGEPPLLVDLHATSRAAMVRTLDNSGGVGSVDGVSGGGGSGGGSGGSGGTGGSGGGASADSAESASVDTTTTAKTMLAKQTLALVKHLHNTGAIDTTTKTRLLSDILHSVNNNTTSSVVNAYLLLVQDDDVADFTNYCNSWVATSGDSSKDSTDDAGGSTVPVV